MRLLKWFLIVTALLVGSTLLAGQLGLFKGKPAARPGVRDGRLAPPSPRPNSVSSQAGLYLDHPMRDRAQIEPLRYSGDGAAAMARLTSIVASMPRTQVVTSGPGYLYATFTSRLLGFVDDVEFMLDAPAGVIHVRSASRLGNRDQGVNRVRVEAIRAAFSSAALSAG